MYVAKPRKGVLVPPKLTQYRLCVVNCCKYIQYTVHTVWQAVIFMKVLAAVCKKLAVRPSSSAVCDA